MSTDLQDQVRVAYKKLKQMVHYEKHPLTLRRRLAEFECDPNFDRRLQEVARVVESKEPHKTTQFEKWIEDIRFDVVPKGVVEPEKPKEAEGAFVSNMTSAPQHQVEKVNYIFDGPVELHLLSVLWLMIEGPEYDSLLSSHCSGTRLHQLVGSDEDHSAHLFRKYHELYAKWRDTGIQKAKDILSNDQKSVCLIGLDVQEYYYRVQLDWEEFYVQIKRREFCETEWVFNMSDVLGTKLFRCVEQVCKCYREKLHPLLVVTHSDLPKTATCLPIGFCASSVIANWYLKVFDDAVLQKVNPAYYGRYVDDILMVVVMPNPPEGPDHVSNFMDRFLVGTDILKRDEGHGKFEISSRSGLFLQKKKCVLQFFDHEHSVAGLEKFQKNIEQNASAFALLPVDGDESPVAQVAYDLLYDGSVNKFRSVKAVAENRWELASHLAKQTQLHLMTEGSIDQNMREELFKFFKGRNAINFWDMWERVLSYLIISGDKKSAEHFSKMINDEIMKVKYSPSDSIDAREVSEELGRTLVKHLELSMELSLAVTEVISKTGDSSPARIWRKSNLIRHHLVAVPLLNYTNYEGNLAAPSNALNLEVDDSKVVHTPRFVHFDECLGFVNSGCVKIKHKTKDAVTRANGIYKKFHGSELDDVSSNHKSFLKVSIGARTPDLHGGLHIAVGHMTVYEENIQCSFMDRSNVSPKRKKILSELLNDVVKHGVRHPEQHVDLLVLPEVSVPHRWAMFITKWAKEHQIGVICGLEHRIDNKGYAWNELLAVLPFRGRNGSKECAPIRRLKRHYSPEERFELTNNNRKIPKFPFRSRYQLYQWRGVSFAIYNCYELASLEDRGIFKGMVDFIVCSEFNKDVNYFSSIVESAARDLHCYVIQVNSAQFGDSRVVSPSKTERLNPLRIKGGDNQTFLTMRLPLQQLRSHQLKGYGLQKDSEEYKPTPPDFDRDEIQKRIALGERTRNNF